MQDETPESRRRHIQKAQRHIHSPYNPTVLAGGLAAAGALFLAAGMPMVALLAGGLAVKQAAHAYGLSTARAVFGWMLDGDGEDHADTVRAFLKKSRTREQALRAARDVTLTVGGGLLALQDCVPRFSPLMRVGGLVLTFAGAALHIQREGHNAPLESIRIIQSMRGLFEDATQGPRPPGFHPR